MARFAEVRRIRPFCLKFVSACWVLCGFISWQLHRDALFQKQVHAGAWQWLVVPVHMFVRYAVCCCVDLWAVEYQHYCVLYSTLAFYFCSLNQRTIQPIKQTVIIEKPLKPVKKFPEFFGPRRFITVFTRAHILSLSGTRLIHSLHCHFLKSHFNIAVPSASRSSKCASFCTFS